MTTNEKAHLISLKESYQERKINPGRLQAIKDHAGLSVLDVGCGGGAYVHALKHDLNIQGVDYQEFESWGVNRDLFTVSNAVNLPFHDNAFETLLCFETLEHLNEPEIALKELHRVCSKNIILSVPNCVVSPGMKKSGLIFNHWIDRTHLNFWEPLSLKEIVEENGFEVTTERLINEIRIGGLLAESIGCKGRLSELIAKVFNRFLQRRKYPTTCLLVAEKLHE